MAFVALILSVHFILMGVTCLLWLPLGRKVAGPEPRCTACGYIVQGLPAPTCPECGSGLARPGAIIANVRLLPGRLARSVRWSMFCAFAIVIPFAAVWLTLVMPAMPQLYDCSELVTLSQPASKGYQSIAVRAHTHAWSPDPHVLPGDFSIELTRSDGATRTLAVNPGTLCFRDPSIAESERSSRNLDADSLVWWLKSNSVPGGTGQLNREMSVVSTQVRYVLSRPPNYDDNSARAFIERVPGGFRRAEPSSNGSTGPPPGVSFTPLAIGVIIWGIGMSRIARKPLRGVALLT